MADVVVTRACEYQGHFYSVGEVVVDHEAGHKLERLGFAAHADAPSPASAEETPPSGNRRASSSVPKEN